MFLYLCVNHVRVTNIFSVVYVYEVPQGAIGIHYFMLRNTTLTHITYFGNIGRGGCDIKRKKRKAKEECSRHSHWHNNNKNAHQIGLLIHMWGKSKPFLWILCFCACACYVRHSLIQYMRMLRCCWVCGRLREDFSLKVNSNILPARALDFLNGNNQIRNIQHYANPRECNIWWDFFLYISDHNILLKRSNWSVRSFW